MLDTLLFGGGLSTAAVALSVGITAAISAPLLNGPSVLASQAAALAAGGLVLPSLATKLDGGVVGLLATLAGLAVFGSALQDLAGDATSTATNAAKAQLAFAAVYYALAMLNAVVSACQAVPAIAGLLSPLYVFGAANKSLASGLAATSVALSVGVCVVRSGDAAISAGEIGVLLMLHVVAVLAPRC